MCQWKGFPGERELVSRLDKPRLNILNLKDKIINLKTYSHFCLINKHFQRISFTFFFSKKEGIILMIRYNNVYCRTMKQQGQMGRE